MKKQLFTIGNGGGSVKSAEQIETALKTPVHVVEIGSVLLRKKEGQKGNTYAPLDDGTTLNYVGLENNGIDWYQKNLPGLLREKREKHIHLNVAGFSVSDFEEIYTYVTKILIQQCNIPIDAVVFNLSCPNIERGIICYKPLIVSMILEKIKKLRTETRSRLKIYIKVSPILDSILLEEIATILSESKIVTGIQTINTVPSCLAFSNGKPVLSPNKGLAGMGGTSVRYLALGQIAQWREILPSRIEVIGLGGISTAEHVLDAHRAGASGVRLTSAPLQYGFKIFSEILADDALENLLIE